jgi:hypothetical protein
LKVKIEEYAGVSTLAQDILDLGEKRYNLCISIENDERVALWVEVSQDLKKVRYPSLELNTPVAPVVIMHFEKEVQTPDDVSQWWVAIWRFEEKLQSVVHTEEPQPKETSEGTWYYEVPSFD